jgi:DNA polymerase I-like protein with 3'-5' exonuclease and polymerase domains
VRRFDGAQNGHLANQALAFVVQGAEAEIMLDALAALHAGLGADAARLVHFVHDEVVVEVPDDAATVEAVSALAERAIADAFRRMFPEASVRGLVEVRVATDWGC